MLTFATAVVLGGLAAPAPHDPGLSSVRVRCGPSTCVVQAAFANADFRAATEFDIDHDGTLDAEELAIAAPALAELVAAEIRLVDATGTHGPLEVRAALAANHDVELTLQFAGGSGDTTLDLAFLHRFSRGHRCYVAALGDDAVVLGDALLHGSQSTFPVPVVAVAPATGFGQGLRFFELGIEHILTGFDHLAFLLALLAAGVTLRRVLATITAFTVAHSLTLATAAMGLVHLPSVLVESTIAASIVWVAAANLAQRGQPAPHRWPLAFGFGLVHGFGFASVLADLHVGGPDMWVPLVTFNLGVEVGQLGFALAVVPLLAVATRHRGTRQLPLVLSIGVGLAGLFWFLQRTLG